MTLVSDLPPCDWRSEDDVHVYTGCYAKTERWNKWLKCKTSVLLIDTLTGSLLWTKCKIWFRQLFSMGESCTPVPSLCINLQENPKALSFSSLGFRLLLYLGQGLILGQLFISMTIVLSLISGFSDPNVIFFHNWSLNLYCCWQSCSHPCRSEFWTYDDLTLLFS